MGRQLPAVPLDEDRKAYAAEHQPFTLPTETDIAKIEADPLAAGSCTYDFVMDGFEAGGGGMRIHNAEMQMSMLKLLGFTEERAESQFGFLMERSSLVHPRWAVSLWVWTRVHAAHRFRLHPRRHGVPQDGQRLRPHVGRSECR